MNKKKKMEILKAYKKLCDNSNITQNKARKILGERLPEKFHNNILVRGTLSSYLTKPDYGADRAPLELFEIMLEILQEEGVVTSSDNQHINRIQDSMYLSMIKDFKVAEGSVLDMQSHLPGHYLMYKQSLHSDKNISKFILTITAETSGAISAKQYIRYQRHDELCEQFAHGYFVGKNNHYFLLAYETDSAFPRTYILRPSFNVSSDNYNTNQFKRLSGSCSGINYGDDGITIFSRKTLLQRIEDDVPKNLKDQAEKFNLGIHSEESEHIPDGVKDVVFNAKCSKGMCIF